jgi:hypothetical protein
MSCGVIETQDLAFLSRHTCAQRSKDIVNVSVVLQEPSTYKVAAT